MIAPQSRPLWKWMALLAVFTLLTGPAWASQGKLEVKEAGDLYLEVNSRWLLPNYGYIPFRIEATNRGVAREFRIELKAGVVESCQRTFSLESNQTAQFTLNFPVVNGAGYIRVRVYINGTEVKAFRQSHSFDPSHSLGSPEITLLMVYDKTPDLRLWNSIFKSSSSSTSSSRRGVVSSPTSLLPSELSSLITSSFRGDVRKVKSQTGGRKFRLDEFFRRLGRRADEKSFALHRLATAMGMNNPNGSIRNCLEFMASKQGKRNPYFGDLFRGAMKMHYGKVYSQVMSSFGYSGPHRKGPQVLDQQLTSGELPSTWISYSGINVVVIGEEEFFDLGRGRKKERQRALIQWVSQGGHLMLTEVDPANRSEVLRQLDKVFPQMHQYKKQYRWRFGKISLVGSNPFAKVDVMFTMARQATLPSPILYQENIKPKPGVLPPAGMCMTFLLLFTFLLVPGCFFFLKKKGQLILLYLVIPILSFTTTVVIFAASFFAEGVTPKVQNFSFSLIDQNQDDPRITVKSFFRIYAPFTPSNGLAFSEDTAIFLTRVTPLNDKPVARHPKRSSHRHYGRRRDSLLLNWTGGQKGGSQHLAGGWLLPREATSFFATRSGPCRLRLIFEKSGNDMVFVNSLGVTVTKLAYALREERGGASTVRYYFSKAPVAPGEKGKLSPTNSFGNSFGLVDFSARQAGVRLENGHVLSGTYAAHVEEWPESRMGVDSFITRKKQHVVVGINAYPQP